MARRVLRLAFRVDQAGPSGRSLLQFWPVTATGTGARLQVDGEPMPHAPVLVQREHGRTARTEITIRHET